MKHILDVRDGEGVSYGSFGYNRCIIDGWKDGEIYINIEGRGAVISKENAVKAATDIINHSYPFTRPKKTVEIRDTGPKVKNFSYWDTTEGKMEYINQGCHRT